MNKSAFLILIATLHVTSVTPALHAQQGSGRTRYDLNGECLGKPHAEVSTAGSLSGIGGGQHVDLRRWNR